MRTVSAAGYISSGRMIEVMENPKRQDALHLWLSMEEDKQVRSLSFRVEVEKILAFNNGPNINARSIIRIHDTIENKVAW